uniref:Growth/differentiation factor 6-like n=1 Tax=Salarias fasciatus TaxID=181472 RepID=A0A672IIR4_SALFA
MSSAFLATAVLLGSSAVMAFVLQPSDVEPAAGRPHRSGSSWQSVRKGLLEALGLRTEPRLAAGALDGVREQWQRTFSSISHRVLNPASPKPCSTSCKAGNSTGPRCCPVTSQVFMKDLGWDTWVIQPPSLTLVQCALCSAAGHTVPCPPPPAGAQEPPPCCQPSSLEMVPVLYMDQFSTLVISSVQLPRSCGCGPGGVQQPGETELDCFSPQKRTF